VAEAPTARPTLGEPTPASENPRLQVGMTYALEPMVIAGRGDTRELSDGWTVVSMDRSLCAHFEHTIAVTDGEPIVLTLL